MIQYIKVEHNHPEPFPVIGLDQLFLGCKFTEVKNMNDVEAERLEWSLKTFTDSSPISSLNKLDEEILEIRADIDKGKPNVEEFADALMCLFDAAGRLGIKVNDIYKAFRAKFEINKKRQWKKNPDNSYSHVK